MAYTYKQLESSDTHLLKGLLKVFGEAFQDISTYQDRVPSDAYLTNFLSQPHVIVLVAMEATEIVGGIVAYELEKFEQERREIYIYDLAVAESHRRQGIATKLIQKLQKIGRERKAYVIFVQADKGDKPAIQLYESFGRREDVYHFDIQIKEKRNV